MRVSTSMQYNKQLHYIQSANSRVDKASQQYNTGKKFVNAGDDPSGKSLEIKYGADIDAYKQYLTNAGMASDTLSSQETALASYYDVLSNVQTRLQQAVNGTMDESSLKAIAEDIEQSIAQLFDLANTKNAEGEYIFSGNQTGSPTFTLRSDGTYICQADGGQRYAQVSPTVTVQISESGLNIFQNSDLAHSFDAQPQAGSPAIKGFSITDYDDFNDVYTDYYSTQTGANNSLRVEVKADANDPSRSIYEVFAPDGTSMGTGEVTQDGKIDFQGMSIDLGDKNYVGNVDVNLQAPQKDNILNQLKNVVDMLRDPDVSAEQRVDMLSKAQISVNNAKVNVDSYRGQIGSRAANVDTIINSNESLSIIKQTAEANVTEIDAFEAVSNLIKEQNGLQVAQQTYSILNQSKLFDYIK